MRVRVHRLEDILFFLRILVLGVAANASSQTTVNLKGVDGRTRLYSLQSHPRVFLDGPSGPITTAVRDPDGPGPQRSGRASGPAWESLVSYTEYLRRSGSPGSGVQAEMAALGWFLDNNGRFSDGTSYLAYAKERLSRVENEIVGLGACDKAVNFCASGIDPVTHVDYQTPFLGSWAFTYTLIRDQLTVTERQAFADKMLTGISFEIEPNCRNRYDRVNGTITYRAGSTTIQGNGTAFDSSMVNRWFYVKDPASPRSAASIVYFYVTRVEEGSQMLIVSRAPASSRSNQHIYQILPWAKGQCGLGFTSSHHNTTPTYAADAKTLRLADPIDAQQTTIRINTARSQLPNFVPFWILNGNESIRVVEVSSDKATLTVIRGDWSTTPQSAVANGALVHYSHMNAGNAHGWHNQLMTRNHAHILLGLALADDDPRAKLLLERAEPYFLDRAWSVFRNYQTLVGTSTNDYSLSRTLYYTLLTISGLKTSVASPALDLSSEWIKRTSGLYFPYWSLPWDQRKQVKWGVQGGACEDYISPQCLAPIPWLQGLYPESPEAKYSWWWAHNQTILDGKSMFDPTWLRRLGSERVIIPLLLFTNSSTQGADYRTVLPSSGVFRQTDNPDPNSTTNLSVAVSKTNWSKQATLFFLLAPDHGPYPWQPVGVFEKFYDNFPGSYGIGKSGWLLNHVRQSTTEGQSLGNMNVMDFGNAVASTYVGPTPPPDQEIDRWRVEPQYFYARADVKSTYASSTRLTRALRHFVHFKDPSGEDRIIVYDDAASETPQRMRTLLHYPNNGGAGEGTTTFDEAATVVTTDNGQARMFSTVLLPQAGVVTDVGVSLSGRKVIVGPDCTSTAPCRIRMRNSIHTITEPATLNVVPPTTGTSSAYLWIGPDGSPSTAHDGTLMSSQCSGTLLCADSVSEFPRGAYPLSLLQWRNGNPISLCPGTTAVRGGREYHHCLGDSSRHVILDAGTTEAAEFVVVHKTTSLSGTPDPAVLLSSIDSEFLGVQIEGAHPKVALFARRGNLPSSVSFQTNFSGTAQILITGLVHGKYTVTKDGTVILKGQPVAAQDNSLFFESASGHFQITYEGTLTLAVLNTALVSARAGASYFATVRAVGGTPPYVWSVTGGSLPDGLVLNAATGDLRGVTTADGTFSFRIQVTDNAVPPATAVRDLVLTVEPPPPLTITTTTLPGGMVGSPFSFTLAADGGIGPYQWSITAGSLPPGLSLPAETGDIGGTPSEAGKFAFTVRVNTSVAETQTDFTLEISPANTTLEITTMLGDAYEGEEYRMDLTAIGGTAPYIWSILSGTLPDGLNLSEEGSLAGTPVLAGQMVTFEILVTDSSTPPLTAKREYMLTVQPAPLPFNN